jgi:hypothetical protein
MRISVAGRRLAQGQPQEHRGYAYTRHQGAIMNFELEFALAGTLKPPVEIGAGPFAPI